MKNDAAVTSGIRPMTAAVKKKTADSCVCILFRFP